MKYSFLESQQNAIFLRLNTPNFIALKHVSLIRLQMLETSKTAFFLCSKIPCISSLFLALACISCQSSDNNWVKLTEEETFHYLVSSSSPFEGVLFESSTGTQMPQIDTALLLYGWYHLSMWRDSTNHERIKFLLHPGDFESEIFMIRVQEYADFKTTPTVEVEVDCKDYATILDSMLYWDQGVRKGEFQGDMFDIDFRNQSYLIKLVDQCGLPDHNEVGDEGLIAMALVSLHTWNTTQNQFYPFIKECTEKKLLNPHFWATLVDRILVSNERMQVFGTQLTEHETTGTLSLDPVRDMANLEARRAAHQLISMEEYMSLFELNWPLEKDSTSID